MVTIETAGHAAALMFEALPEVRVRLRGGGEVRGKVGFRRGCPSGRVIIGVFDADQSCTLIALDQSGAVDVTDVGANARRAA